MTPRPLAAIVIGVTVAAGCAQQPPASPAADTSNPAVRACLQTAGAAPWQGVVQVEHGLATVDAHDDYFEASCIVVPWDRQVRLTVTNRGHLPHDVTIPGLGLKTDLDAGQTVFVTLPATTVPLRFVCSYHVAEHMFGAIVPVRPAEDGTDAPS